MTKVLSCIQPTGNLHIGNFLGAIKIWIALQENKECDNYFGIADLHSLTKINLNPTELRIDTNQLFLELIACGLNPNKSTIFVQSLIPEHAELAWILGLVTSHGSLGRQVQYKELKKMANEKKDKFIPLNIFTYPVLQAADILIYRSNYVPIGDDQKQHLELTRDIAKRFNTIFGKTFPIPQGKFTKTPRIKSLADPNRKMSKSYGNKHFIGLFEDEKSIREKIMSAVTDSGAKNEKSLGVKNLFDILYGCGKKEVHSELSILYENNALKYKILKEEVANAVVELTSQIKQRKSDIKISPALSMAKLREKSEEARKIAKETLFEVKEKVGIKNISYI